MHISNNNSSYKSQMTWYEELLSHNFSLHMPEVHTAAVTPHDHQGATDGENLMFQVIFSAATLHILGDSSKIMAGMSGWNGIKHIETMCLILSHYYEPSSSQQPPLLIRDWINIYKPSYISTPTQRLSEYGHRSHNAWKSDSLCHIFGMGPRQGTLN